MARSPPLLCELAPHERRRLGSGAKATGTPEYSNDAKVCPPESSVFEPAGESTRQEVAGPFGRITKQHNAASGGKVIVRKIAQRRGSTRPIRGCANPVRTSNEIKGTRS